MSNSLTRRVGLTFGPLFLETLVKHYFSRVVSDGSKAPIPLRRDELLYDAAFNIVKNFLDGASRHTVEELQSLLNVRTPSPPWVHVVRLVIPTVSCDEAAVYLIKAFGGEDMMKRVVGGTKWWQVRSIRGLNAEWISAKKDWQNAQKRAKECRSSVFAQEHTAEHPELRDLTLNDVVSEPPVKLEGEGRHQSASNSKETSRGSAEYQPEMDEMRCILYAHGGGYYFGSVDQERYSIQRYARKIHGRVLAVNYRLAPQYPFPCAIQDLLAAYIFLISPPEGAAHRPVRPEHIVIAGDSAGGGLSLALLQVIRDSGLPAPAGGVLISPWCDLTHSFPSILTNTDTDVIPATGLSLHKPSPLWPPPSNDVSCKVHSDLRKSISDVHRRSEGADQGPSCSLDPENVVPKPLPTTSGPTGSAAPLPPHGVLDTSESIMLRTADGEVIEVAEQVQLYAPNSLLKHPLVSPALSYLGGLPPLFFIAGDKEVLRDEIIYAAHRAAHPERFPMCNETKDMYPTFKHVDQQMRPTPVHLQVYDDIAHILPILFPFTTPGKYSYRAVAQFVKHVTGAPPAPLIPGDMKFSTSPAPLAPQDEIPTLQVPSPRVHRSISSRVQSAASGIKRRSSLWSRPSAQGNGEPALNSDISVDVAGPRIGGSSEPQAEDVPRVGEAWVYAGDWAKSAGQQDMIRERVSTQGIIRPLEPEPELPAMQVPPELVGTHSEHAVRRYVAGNTRFAKKFARAIRHIEKHRQRNIDRASRDTDEHIAALRHYLDREKTDASHASWALAWALDADERPPPSSIVARRDTAEALKLARVADKAALESERALSANNLWSVVVGFLTVSPDEHPKTRGDGRARVHVVGARKGRAARLGSFFGGKRRSGSTPLEQG
ncbi:hypothetical protein EI94DRAFT_1829826 [Lactarius quietus]|nr:hypothetical protein EI94DRAFT_1833924 [Lactarius quietus]KAF8267933.1 hypothetical protein EI94DRAFT_1829826 [Lactarius quietus]